ncbi:MAG: hypothetical protein A2451_12635 [Bdellovibrionales bacterium RIFOXYC2_FULL_39_8]|nr:MAG: hypothetical protein A2451_12635 [Bdellovibrionales bacterium RIFOXYC2_FULL_39_8]
MVRYGIPKFRLPWNKLDSEIKSIIDLGVKVHTNKRLGTDFSIADLQKKGADAVLIAIGAQVSKPMGIENEQVDGILGGVEFLRKVVLGEKIKHGRKVAVVGGGDVAMDCARVAKRLAPNMDVHLLYRRTQQEMPALKHEQEECHEEGVHFQFLTAPKAVVVGSDGRARALKVAQMRLGAPDASGRRRPEEVPGSEKDLDFDLIISAIGQDPEVACLEKDPIKLETTKWKTVVYDNKNMTTKVPGIFTAGDCSFGPNTVVQACAEGKIAADAISLYLNGADIKFREEYRISKGRIKELEREDFAPRFEQKKRQKEIIYKADKRLANGGYAPINESLTQIQSMAEASRCIECGCSARFNCSLRDYSTEYGACETIMPGKKNQPEIDKRHPLIRFEGEKCINCGSCVRVCNEVRQISALSFVDRGFKTHIAPNFERPLQATDCDACGMCIDVCPTGTIVMNHSKYEGVWEGPKAITTCTACGRGCALQVSSVDEKKIIKASSVANDKVNGGVICKEGRFSYALLKYKLNKENSNKSISHAKKLITKMKKPAIFVSPWLALEDLAAAGKLAQKLKGTLFYLTDPKRKGKEKHLFAKLPGVTNVAFLEKIGAKPANTKTNFNKADGAIILGAYLSKKLPRSIPVVAISNFAIGTKAHSYLHHLDQLERNGSFLNVDGVVRPLASDIKSSQPTIAELLAKLSGIDATSGISKEVSKLKVKKAIVAPDAREMAFAKYLHKMGL